MQDDEQDWYTESSQMARIYENAVLTLAGPSRLIQKVVSSLLPNHRLQPSRCRTTASVSHSFCATSSLTRQSRTHWKIYLEADAQRKGSAIMSDQHGSTKTYCSFATVAIDSFQRVAELNRSMLSVTRQILLGCSSFTAGRMHHFGYCHGVACGSTPHRLGHVIDNASPHHIGNSRGLASGILSFPSST